MRSRLICSCIGLMFGFFLAYAFFGMNTTTAAEYKTVETDYKAYVTSVHDGDTFTCDIYLGFGMVLTNQKVRMLGINAAELSTAEGKRVAKVLQDKLTGKEIALRTIRNGNDSRDDKYGRLLGTVILDGVDINQWMLDNRYAEVYND